MHAKTRLTALVIGAATAVATTALFLERPHAAATRRTPAACGEAGPAHADVKLDHGHLSASVSAARIVRGAGEVHAAFELATDRVQGMQRPPLDLAFVIDHSGSMDGGRLDHAKSSARGIVERLDERDHVALIQFDNTAEVVVASLAMDPPNKAKLERAIDGLQLGGGTNLESGLELGRDEVQRAFAAGELGRVILLSDGRANVGVVDPTQIAGTARDAANHGIRITSVGIGLDFNEDLMEAIAEAGRGNYHYVKEAQDLDKVISGELADLQATVATNVELRLTPACAGAAIVAVHGYDSHRDGAAMIVPLADLFGGDSRKLLVSMTVPAAALGPVGALHAELVYKNAAGGEQRTTALDLGVEVTDDTAAATASIDASVMAQVLQLQAAESMRQAAQAYERGDDKAAVQILDQSQHDIAQKGIRYKVAPAKSAAVLGEMGKMESNAKAYKPGSYQGQDMLKQSKEKARYMSKH